MSKIVVFGTKTVIALLFVVTLIAQFLLVPLLAQEMAHEFPEVSYLQWPGIIGCVCVLLCGQVVLVCVWRLLSMVAKESIFSSTAFTIVNVTIAAIFVAAVLVIAALIVLQAVNALPGGVMIMLLTGALLGTGLGLLLIVMRGLLKKATLLDQDLAGVI